jgi:pimeloyl-ACP methyl ester carboxylesterase
MDSIQSKDGTQIRYFRRGHGPAILLIHGTAADHSRWAPVVRTLQRQFTVYAMDRRGRGGSGDAAAYRMEDEFADVAATVRGIERIDKGPIDVVGHSYGGVCAMESVFCDAGIRRLVLYEPPIAVLGGSTRASEAIANVRGLIAEGNGEAALEYFYGTIAQIPPRALSAMRTLPAWDKQVRAVHTVLRELEAMANYELRPERFRAWRIPTLLLLGGDSPPVYRAGIERMQAMLPGSKIAVLEGQGHVAMKTAPKLFVQKVLEFLNGPSEAAALHMSPPGPAGR